ncbi:MAG: hypothetical protein L6Q95_03255 [Planctomycetes bacterium]|nr:hypothetical protein [Planctomycetota bacterium]
MDCHDFLHLAAGYRDGSLTRYARAVFEWHRATCPRCAAATARTAPARPRMRRRAPQHARVS